MICRDCAHENPRGARFCNECSVALDAICVNCGQANPAAARFCNACGHALEEATASGNVALKPEQPDDPDATAERRQLTVMFCDLVESTALAARLDAEEWREMVRAYQAACGAAIARYEGYVAQHLGDGMLIYFGFPMGHEDDPRRAVLAGLAIFEELERLNEQLQSEHSTRLEARIGIHTGPVVVGEMGFADRREALALGDTVNLASRLQSVAEPGTVVISHAIRRRVQGFFFLEDRGSMQLKGIANPEPVVRVLGASGFQTRLEVAAETGLSPLVGREQELALLIDRFELARAGHGQGVLLSGEAGIGKSRLVHAMRERLADVPHSWLECRGSPYHGSSALYPIVGLLEQGLLFTPDDSAEDRIIRLEAALRGAGLSLPDVVPLLASLLSIPLPDRYGPVSLSADAARRKTMESLVAWLLAAAEDQPITVFVEDLHWIDPSTLELLGMLLEQAPTSYLLLLFTARPAFDVPWSGGSELLQLGLHPLTRSQIEALVDSMTDGKSIPALIRSQLIEKTDGVPLFVEELTKSVLESDLLVERDHQYERSDPLPPLAIPATLQDSLMARLDRLGSAKRLAQLCAVLGREFSHELLEAVFPDGAAALEAALDELVRSQLIYRRGVAPLAIYTFKHALIQDTAYESLLRSTRREFHGLVARVLEQQFAERAAFEPEEFGRHHEEAGNHLEAAEYYRRAGERAAERSAHLEAAVQLSRALTLLGHVTESRERDERELALQTALGASYVATRGHGDVQVERAYGRARELCHTIGHSQQAPRALFGLFTYYQIRGEMDSALELADELDALGSDEPSVGAMIHTARGIVCHWQGAPVDAVREFELAISAGTGGSSLDLARFYGHDPDVLAQSFVSWALFFTGQPDRALLRARQGVERARAVEHPYSLGLSLAFLSIVHHMRREPEAALTVADEVVALSRQQSFPQWLGVGMMVRGWSISETQGIDAGFEEITRGLEHATGTGMKAGASYVLSMLADAHRAAGRPDEAIGILNGALELAAKQGTHFWDAELHRLIGECLRQQYGDESKDAEQALRRAFDTARAQRAASLELRAAISLGGLFRARGKDEAARVLVEAALDAVPEGLATGDRRDARALLDSNL